ncbi:alpha/beta hydrolase family protein [Brucella pseudogrignonensis]|uniref:alpha/beta hydrolase family protein n=1 Tax=Brucella pseudogrignonensis TaxID=419475 RepID=UPI003D9967A1
MKRPFLLAAFITVKLMIIAPNADAYEVGVREIKVPFAERKTDLSVAIWYPAQKGGEAISFGENKVFKGTEAYLNAPLAAGKFPVILLSHGSGGRVETAGWLAAKLAEAGFVVAGPNHPGTTSGNSLPAETPKLWQRTHDISDVASYLASDAEWSPHLKADQMGVVGFSLGGATALELIGARANLEAFATYCDQYDKWDCAWYQGGVGYADGEAVKVEKVNLRTIDKKLFEQSNLDARIKSAVLIDPGLVHAYVSQSLKDISVPSSFINFGAGNEIPFAVIADKVSSQVSGANYETVSGADHFSFLPVCHSGAADFLKSIGEIDPICNETSKSRSDIHDEVSELVLKHMDETLQK